MYRIILSVVMMVWTSSCLLGQDMIVMDPCDNPRNWQLNEGNEFPGAAGKLYLDPATGKMTLEGKFTQKGVYVAAVFCSPVQDGATYLEFKIVPDTDCDVAIRVADTQERYYQTKTTRLKAQTAAMVSIDLASTTWLAKWGGKQDKTATMPQAPYRSIALNVMRLGRAESVKVRLEEIRIRRPEFSLNAELLPRPKFSLFSPDTDERPHLQFYNAGFRELNLSGTVTIISYDDGTISIPLDVSLTPDSVEKLPLPFDKGMQNVWRIKWNLKDKTSGREFDGQDRFANMIPAGVTPGREKGFLFSVSTHVLENRRGAETEAQAASLCGAKVIRDTLKWRYIQPAPGVWNYTFHDNVVSMLEKYNLELQAILLSIPDWAYNKEVPVVNPRKVWSDSRCPEISPFKEYIQRTAERYHGKIRYYEVMNEPDLESFANYPVENYMELLKTAYSTIKAVDSSAHVMNGGIAWLGSERSRKGLVQQILASGNTDIFAFHGHGSFEAYMPQIQQLNKLLVAYRQPWYANETAISSVAIGELMQAKTLYYKLIHTWAQGSIGYTWYDLFDDGTDSKNGEHHYGLLTHDAKPKIAYLAYNMLATHFRGAKFLKRMDTDPGVYAYLFRASNGDYLLASWSSLLVTEHLFQIFGINDNAVKIDLIGNKTELPVDNRQTVFKVGNNPVTLRFSGEDPRLVELLSADQMLSVKPGIDKEFTFRVRNPDSSPRRYDIKCMAPSGLSVIKNTCAITVPAGKTEKVSFAAKVSRSFQSHVGAYPQLTLQISSKVFQTESISFPVMIENIIPEAEYPKEPQFILNHSSQYHSFVINQPANAYLFWEGPQDLSAKVYLAHSPKTMRIKVIVMDDKHVQPYHDMDVWQGDNIQLAMKWPGQNIFWELGLTRLANGQAEVFAWQVPDGFKADESVKNIKLTTLRNELLHQTVYEVEIPFLAIGLTDKIGKQGFLFNMIVNDNDGNMREGFIGIAPGLGEEKNPAKYPIIRFK